MRFLRPLVLFAFISASAGCVSSSRLEDAKGEIVDLKWKLEAAERATTKAESERKLAFRELELVRKNEGVMREQLALESEALKQTRREMDEDVRSRLEELQSKAPGKHELSQYGGVIFETGILFASGRHELTKQGEEALGPIAESLAGPKYEGFVVEIAGHTDSDPLVHTAKRYDDNHDLAAKRANSVRRFLCARGVPEARLFLSAFGETRPLKGDDDGSGKAANRRVEILLHKQGPSELPASMKPEMRAPEKSGS